MARTLDRPVVRASTLLGMAVMEMLDVGSPMSIMVHDVPDVERERLLNCLVTEHDFERNDSPENRGKKGVTGYLAGERITVDLWPSACPECYGSGVDSMDRGERCPVCKGRG